MCLQLKVDRMMEGEMMVVSKGRKVNWEGSEAEIKYLQMGTRLRLDQ